MVPHRSQSPAGEKALFVRQSGSSSRGNSATRAGSSGGGGLLANIKFAQHPVLKVELAERVVYVFPKYNAVPDWDNAVEGTVSLVLPKPRSLRNLSVRLVGKTDVAWTKKGYESFNMLEKTIELVPEDKGIKLDAGEHVFAFNFIMPSNSASSERCHWGRVRYSVSAKAPGLGYLGGELVSNEAPLAIVVNPGANHAIATASEPPPPLQYKFEGFDDALGPWSAVLQSQHIVVGGLLQLKLDIWSPPADFILDIHHIRVKITCFPHLKSPPHREPYSEFPAPQHHTVCLLDSQHPPNMGDIGSSPAPSAAAYKGPLVSLRSGTTWRIQHVMRLLNHHELRPTTQPGTETCINVRHDIAIEVTYSQRPITPPEESPPTSAAGGGKQKKPERTIFRLSKPISLWSCFCWLDSLTLPAYSEQDPNPSAPESEVPCLCQIPIAPMLKHHGGLFSQLENENDILSDALVVKVGAKEDEEMRRSGRVA